MKLLPGSEDYSKNSVNAAKVTDHHALLITENAAIGLFKDEKIIYDMILCRMIEAFSADCIKDITSVSAQVDHEVEFGISGSIIRQTGWRALLLKERTTGWTRMQTQPTMRSRSKSFPTGKKDSISLFLAAPSRRARPNQSHCIRNPHYLQQWRPQAKR